jgi:hypothetical protein
MLILPPSGVLSMALITKLSITLSINDLSAFITASPSKEAVMNFSSHTCL